MKPAPGTTPPVTLDMLQHNRLFQGVQPNALQVLMKQLSAKIAMPGEWIMREGEVADYMFVILNGELEVLSHGGSGSADVRVALLGPGDWVGEMAVLDAHPQRSASVRSLAPSLLMRLTLSDVGRLQQEEPLVYAGMLRNIACELGRRLRVADRLIARTSAAMAKQYVLESMRPPRN
jgi:CRP/FNR family cyclic AMP-dependent transcriptional regulator